METETLVTHRVKEITVGSGRQIKFGDCKAHMSMTILIPESYMLDDIQQVAMTAATQCNMLVQANIDLQVDAHANPTEKRMEELVKGKNIPLDKDEIPNF